MIVGSSPAAALLAGCGGEESTGERGTGEGMMDRRMPDWMMSRADRVTDAAAPATVVCTQAVRRRAGDGYH
ncbi:MAG: hypothetical protein M3459_13480 [Actinomycetota bacterium]|nr:hypothetical protein [Actinomycetota bacterium]